jgi:hypothetical protein
MTTFIDAIVAREMNLSVIPKYICASLEAFRGMKIDWSAIL